MTDALGRQKKGQGKRRGRPKGSWCGSKSPCRRVMRPGAATPATLLVYLGYGQHSHGHA
jgi:hypothetical protein